MVRTIAKVSMSPLVKTQSEMDANMVVTVVMIERVKVSLRDLFTISVKFFACMSLMFSLIRSRITTVALIEYPKIVRIAASVVVENSIWNHAMKVNIMRKSWSKAMTAPRAKSQWKRIVA